MRGTSFYSWKGSRNNKLMMLCLKNSSKLIYQKFYLSLSLSLLLSLFSIVNWTAVSQSHTKVINLYRGFHMKTAFSVGV